MIAPLIIIPTYWGKGSNTDEDAIYDHPTDLLQPNTETLSATLKSFLNIEGTFEVLVLGIPTNPSIGLEMDSKIITLIRELPLSFPIRFFGSSSFELLIKSLHETEISEYVDLVSNRGYGNIRNLCLILAQLLDFEVTILIDDDEIITDNDFLGKALEIIGQQKNGKKVDLVLGYYLNANGTPLLDKSELPWWQAYWDKTGTMNQAFQIILDQDQPRFIQNPSIALGGLMVIHKNCWLQVPFDPLISRGEDMDYLRNAHYLNFITYLDRELFIMHKPPPTSFTSFREKMNQDIKRFLYAKHKMNTLQISSNDYDPYPGYFLSQTEGKVLLTEILYAIHTNPSHFISVTTRKELINLLKQMDSVFEESLAFAKENANAYLTFQKLWEKLMQKLTFNFSLAYLNQ